MAGGGGGLGPGRAVKAGSEAAADAEGRRGRGGPHGNGANSVCKGSEAGGSGSFQAFLSSKDDRTGARVGGFVRLQLEEARGCPLWSPGHL